jgi:fibronectin type 3 domain-containing protein
MVQRVVNAILGGGCRTDTYHPHAVTLNWVASTTPNVTYSVHRSESASGPYTLVKSGVRILSYFDPNVIAGRTYYYVVTAVDSGGNASANSNQATATIPTP